ncbi:MAG: DUF2252 domain-containing protein [Acidimicrobiia bacterium]
MTSTETPEAPKAPKRLTPSERAELGKAARKAVPRTSHAEWDPGADRPDPVALLQSQEEARVAELVPLRHERMLVSPFTFYRGAALVMASDLSLTPTTGLRVQLCGDAHLANFGGFAAPDRSLIFDINDFDETSPGSFEWDVKRLAASFEIAARDNGFTAKKAREAVLNVVGAYRTGMAQFAGMRNLEVLYARADVQQIVDHWSSEVTEAEVKRLQGMVAKAQSKDSTKALSKLAVRDGDTYRIKSDPPVVVPVSELAAEQGFQMSEDELVDWLRTKFTTYRRSLQADRRHLLDGYELVDFARKVVGVGSVGTRCWIALFLGRDDQDPLFLQIKEATSSVLSDYAGRSGYANHGQRVVEGQRLLQAASDTLLGWLRATGLDSQDRDFYVRQLWDWKVSAVIETMTPSIMRVYAQLCGWTLARGHARSGDRIAISSYLGSSDTFDNAIADFARAYADQNERDHAVAAQVFETPASGDTAADGAGGAPA